MSRDTMRIKLFGSLREFANKETGEVVVKRGHTQTELKTNLSLYLQKNFPNSEAEALVKFCALADEKTVLPPQASLENYEWIAFLPPVCGG